MRLPRLIEHRLNFGPKAPITEALLEIRVPDRGAEFNVEILHAFGDLAQGFPRVLVQREKRYTMVGNKPAEVTKSGVRGYVFSDQEQTRAIQARRDGLTYSQFHGYTSWGDLLRETKNAWANYVKLANPGSTTRLSVKYTNRITIPQTSIVMAEWFRVHPTLPSELGLMVDFFQRVVVHHAHDPSYLAMLTVGAAPQEVGTEMPAVLYDIEAWTDVTIPPASEDIWEVFENLREFKNDLFFGFLGPRLREQLG